VAEEQSGEPRGHRRRRSEIALRGPIDTAIDGTPSRLPSIAAATVPE
jgi:hypothetical protein